MSDSIGKVSMDLETNTGPFQQQLNGIAGKSANMVKSAFGGIAKAAIAAFSVKALVSFGKASIDLASDLQEVQNVVDVVFGESANTINNFAKTALNSYGLSELSAKQYTSTMGAMLKSMGLASNQVLNMSQSLTALAGDMASFYNLDSDDAFNKLRAGISGETEPLKQLGINMSVANMEAYAMSQGITAAYQKMSQSEQALLRYNYLLSVTSDAQGDFARTSNSWANQTRILSEQWNSFKATMGSAFIAMLTPVIQMLNWLISKLQIAAAYFKAFVEFITGTKSEASGAVSGFTAMADSAIEAGDAAISAGDSAASAAKKASKALAGFDKLNVLSQNDSGGSGGGGSGGSGGGSSGMPEVNFGSMSGLDAALPTPDMSGVENVINTVRGLFESLSEYITTAFAPTFAAWGDAFTSIQEPLMNTVVSIGESLLGLWENTLAPFSLYLLEEFIPPIVNSFSETFAPIFSEVLVFALEQFSSSFAFACEQVNSLVNDIVIPALELFKTVFVGLCEGIKKEWDKSGSFLLKKFKEVIDGIKKIWLDFYNIVLKPIWQKIVSGLTILWENHLKPLWENLLMVISKLCEAVLTLWNNVLAPFVNWVISTFGPLISSTFNHLWDLTVRVFGNIADAASDLLKALGGLLDFVTGVFSGDWNKAWNGIKTFFKGVWDAMVNIVKAPINLIIGFINSLLHGIASGVNFAIRGLNKLSFEVPGWVPVIGGSRWGFNIKEVKPAQIPYLKDGGIIDQPTLAMVGEQGKEAVVPLENTAFADAIANAILRAILPLFGNGGSSTKDSDGNTIIVLKVGEYELGRVSVGAINKYHNIIGRVELEV